MNQFTAVYNDGEKFIIAHVVARSSQSVRRVIEEQPRKRRDAVPEIYAIFSGFCKPVELTDEKPNGG